MTPLEFGKACTEGCLGRVRRFDGDLDEPGVQFGYHTGLTIAAKSGEDGVVRALIEEMGADPEATDGHSYQPRTPLMWAVRHDHPATVEVLVGLGAGFRSPEGSHEDLLSLASSAEMKEKLLALGAPVDIDRLMNEDQ